MSLVDTMDGQLLVIFTLAVATSFGVVAWTRGRSMAGIFLSALVSGLVFFFAVYLLLS
jgi:hypothetical protein